VNDTLKQDSQKPP